jgi:DNA primase
MITQRSIEAVLSAANIVDVIGSEVPLKKSGVNHKGCCPFHNEATPSFMVNEVKQIFKCFGCGEGGNVVAYLMKKNRMTFPEAITELGKRYGVEVEREKEDDETIAKRATEEKQKEAILYINEMAARFFASQLPAASEAMEYLQSRLHDDDIAAWHLGWAPEGWDNLLNHFREKGVKEEAFLATGLIRESEKTGKLYDFFRNRVMFPIHNLAGRVIGFAGRIIEPGSKEPKYINSPETLVYNKSSVLYGLQHAYNSLRSADRCFLVEGYTDVIAMHRGNITNTLAACGTSVTDEHLRLIGRFTKHIHLVGDGDKAGLKSMARAGEMAIKLGMSVHCTVLPQGQDPYDIIKHYHE